MNNKFPIPISLTTASSTSITYTASSTVSDTIPFTSFNLKPKYTDPLPPPTPIDDGPTVSIEPQIIYTPPTSTMKSIPLATSTIIKIKR